MRVTKTSYPCCAKSCRLKWEPGNGSEVITRDHYCSTQDSTGTRYRIALTHVPIAEGIEIDRVEFMDLASDEAFGLYGRRQVPHRTAAP